LSQDVSSGPSVYHHEVFGDSVERYTLTVFSKYKIIDFGKRGREEKEEF